VWLSAQDPGARGLKRCAMTTEHTALANGHNALVAVCAIPLEGFAIATPEHTALANEHNALRAVGVITIPEHTALANGHNALTAIDTALILG
jgi:hypothetical protein